MGPSMSAYHILPTGVSNLHDWGPLLHNNGNPRSPLLHRVERDHCWNTMLYNNYLGLH